MTNGERVQSALRQLFDLVSDDITLTLGIGVSVAGVFLVRGLVGARWASTLLVAALLLLLLENVWRSAKKLGKKTA